MQEAIRKKKTFGTRSKPTKATRIAQPVLLHSFLPYETICLQKENHIIIIKIFGYSHHKKAHNFKRP